MNRDWLAYFKAKRGMGAVICEGPEIEAACAEIEALLARHNALVEAVAWLLDAQSIVDENITRPNWRRHVGISDIVRTARAEVDRLLQEEKP